MFGLLALMFSGPTPIISTNFVEIVSVRGAAPAWVCVALAESLSLARENETPELFQLSVPETSTSEQAAVAGAATAIMIAGVVQAEARTTERRVGVSWDTVVRLLDMVALWWRRWSAPPVGGAGRCAGPEIHRRTGT